MAPRQAPTNTATPPTPIEPPKSPSLRRLRSRSSQFLNTFIHETRSRSSSASSRHPRSPDSVKDVIAHIGLAAGTIGAEHIKPQSLRDEDILEGVRTFLSGLQNIIRRVKAGLGDDVEAIEVGDDAQSVHGSHPITEAKNNPFGIFTDEDTDTAPGGPPDSDQHAEYASHEDRGEVSVSREQSFGEFVMDVFMYEKESGEKLPGSARLDTGMTLNAVSYSQALLLGHPIEEYKGDPCVVADGSFYRPIGQVTIPFKFVSFRTAQTWRVEFIVFPEGSPFDICLGRRFIWVADLLKRNPEALPVEFRKLKPSKEREYEYKTQQAERDTHYTRESENGRYDNRRNIKPRESKKWY